MWAIFSAMFHPLFLERYDDRSTFDSFDRRDADPIWYNVFGVHCIRLLLSWNRYWHDAKDLLNHWMQMSQARTGSIPHVMAALRNTAMSVLRFNEYTKIAETMRLDSWMPRLTNLGWAGFICSIAVYSPLIALTGGMLILFGTMCFSRQPSAVS